MAADGKRKVATNKREMLDPIDWLDAGAISLPDDVKEGDLGASYAHGVLDVFVPLPTTSPQPRNAESRNRAA